MNEDRPGWETIESRLIELGLRILREDPATLRHPEQETMPEWQGAEVWIMSDPEHRPPSELMYHVHQIRTRHARVLTWLFLELRDAFGGWIDFSNKRQFYLELASAAGLHWASDQPESADPRPMLKAVVGRAFGLRELLRHDGTMSIDEFWLINHYLL